MTKHKPRLCCNCVKSSSEEMASRKKMKRARLCLEEEEDKVETELAMANRENEHITDAIVKFLVSINAPIDNYKNSHFRTLLSKVAQHGVPSCLLHEDSLSIQRSLWNLEHVVNQHIMEVKDSWKTTGCTMMMYKLNEGKGSLSSFHKDNLVIGFYSTKGLFFVEGRTLPHSGTIRDALKNHVLNLPIEDVTQAIYHPRESGQPCELSAFTPYCGDQESSFSYMPCLQQKIYQVYRKFGETPDCWVQKTIKRADIIHKYILDNGLYIDWEHGEAQMAGDGMNKGWFGRILSVMYIENELKTWLLRLPEHRKCSLENEPEILEIIESDEFWQDLRQLELALVHLFRVPDLLDNLIPTSGYVQVAMNAAIEDGQYDESEIDSKYFDSLSNGNHLSHIQDAATYLSPGFYLYHQKEGNLDQIKRVKQGLESIVGEEEKEAMHLELEAYIKRSSNPFANLADRCAHLKYHPVTLWNKYGDGFPVLKKCAIKVLSQPVSCMCRQVKKQLSLIEGKDNLILRLNLRMMEEFKRLGDGIYKHVEY